MVSSKDLYCKSTYNSNKQNNKNKEAINKVAENVSKDVFCYEGGVNNPPDAMIRNQGDAIEIKKIESKIGGIQLNILINS